MSMMSDCLIIGAGPYGLSLAAHLRGAGVDYRIVGTPMEPWLKGMPAGMHLKSEGFASTLFEPTGRFTLEAYCAQQGIPYADVGIPVKIETFIAYGQAFQKRCVPNLEERKAKSVAKLDDGFRVVMEDGGTIDARRVVIASGIVHHARIPDELAILPSSLLSHSSQHHDMTPFKGRDVIVVGAGSSAMDMAAALHQGGAAVSVVARRSKVRFQTPLGTRPLMAKIRAPMTSIGPGWKSVLCTKMPLVFHRMPEAFRVEIVRRYLGPAPAWFTRDIVENNVPIIAGANLTSVREVDGRAQLTIQQDGAEPRIMMADHVIAATGFKIDVSRLGFLNPGLQSALRCDDGAPRLSNQFESSVRGLYFVGTASANSFGPMLRFACGAGFTARRLSRHLRRAAGTARRPAHSDVAASPDAVAAR